MSDLDTILKALRLVPEFDGNQNVLTRFIKLCDSLFLEYGSEGIGKIYLLNGILNKIVGPAARLINTNGVPNEWSGIRSALVNNFADQRDEIALYNDLALLTQGSNTPQEFYEICQNLFSTIITYVSLHETLNTTIDAKRDLYKKLTLQAFLRGLKDPLGSRIRCMRPESIEKALEFVHEENNILYMQRRSDSATEKKPQPISNNNTNQTSKFHNQPFKVPNYMTPRPPFMPQPWKPNFAQNRPPGPTRTQQMFGAPIPNYQHQGFKIPPRNPGSNPGPSGPKPMSGVSHYSSKPLPSSGYDWRRFNNPPPSNYFKTKEMNYNNCADYNYDYYDDYNNYDEYYDYDNEQLVEQYNDIPPQETPQNFQETPQNFQETPQQNFREPSQYEKPG